MGFVGIDGPGGIEITIGFLRFADNRNQRIYIGFHFCVGMNSKRKRSTFNGFVNIRIVEWVFGTELSFFCGSHDKITYPARDLASGERSRYGNRPVDFNSGKPETVGKFYLREQNALDRIVFLLAVQKRRTTEKYKYGDFFHWQ